MDEKNANGEINANESVKQLSDSDAQSVESAAEAREFDVVTEKPAQRQEKKTKNAAKRPSGKQRSEATQVVTKTAVRTLVVLVAALILIFAFYILVFPASSGSFCYTVGMKNTSAWLASRAAKKSGEVDDYYTAFLRAVDAKNWSIVERSGRALLVPAEVDGTKFTSSDFTDFCDELDDNEILSERDFSTKTYVQYNYIYSIAVRLDENDENIFNLAKSYINSGSSYYYAGYNPLKAYIDAAVKNKKLEPNMILDEFMDYYQSYSWRDEIGGDHSTAQRYMRQDLKRLVEARMGEKDKQGNITVVWEEGNEVHDFWKDKLN